MTPEALQRLRELGARRDEINAERTTTLADLRAAIRDAHAAGVGPSQIARVSGLSRQAVRLALQN